MKTPILFFKLMVLMTIFYSCKDDDKAQILSTVEVNIKIDENYNFIPLENTTIRITNIQSGETDSTKLLDATKVLFTDLIPGDYQIQAYRHLTDDEKESLYGDKSTQIYITSTQNIKAGAIKDIRIYLTLKPNVEFLPAQTLTVNNFIYTYMDYAYFWHKEMPEINYRTQRDPEAYFYSLLKDPDDKWSFITDDIEALIAYFDGVSKSKGYSIQPYYLRQGSNQVIIYVEYVYRNSPASEAGLQRGDMIHKINGETVTDQNYQRLLNNDNMVLTLGYLDDSGNIVSLSPEVEINAVENLQHHPIIASSIHEVEGSTIGYIAYSSFTASYDTALVNTFSDFKAAGVNELVLDLRYNGGGRVTSAVLLAGLIAPKSSVGEVFIEEVWNENLKNYNAKLRIPNQSMNLDLSRVYILTTSGTASASEMVIYGLAPHMEVIQIGTQTHGKYYGSIMIQDIDENTNQRRHSWALQPIVMRAQNVTNDINYQQGLPPNHTLRDNIYNAQLGDIEEHFLSNAISLITSGSLVELAPELKKASIDYIKIENFKENNIPYHGTMITELP
ncbi:S41 family peptidase [Alkalitalea saponilacus]|uniref:Peptidase family S41 n=1 Tax=Alkalitalea saponilacus TaxID=889453 RepID=A0A1T5HRY2_9BACT|nr:S41 family peptidase [Alkalitalea saponilacus]ASB50027.1 peptidase S41 [Alkalitalea saponilacus]SKC23458.1 Peptidase family S41 [Alkalitalea saponilacus]